jgi:hypothetical protein
MIWLSLLSSVVKNRSRGLPKQARKQTLRVCSGENLHG